MKQLGWTSLDQAEQLIEAGLDPNTADMWYHNGEQKPKPYREHRDFVKSPCWSLGALIDFLPKTIETKKPKNLYFPEIFPANNCVAYAALNENKEYVFLKSFATGTESELTLLDNMVSMICWLLKDNYIKKEN